MLLCSRRLAVLMLTSSTLLAAACGGPASSGGNPAPAPDAAESQPVYRAEVSRADPLHPRVRLVTNHGAVVVELDTERAPITVANFLRYVESGHYAGTIFHQVERDFILALGGYTKDLKEKPAGIPIRNEADNGLRNVRGTIAMAREPDVIDSSTGQFFFNLADNPQLDHHGREPGAYGYCVFGKVVAGLEVLERIANLPCRAEAGFASLPAETALVERINLLR